MKKFSFLPPLIFLSLFLALLSGCGSDDKVEPDQDWTEQDQLDFDDINRIQSEADDIFTGYLATMDTSAAKAALANYIRSDPAVEWAVANEQGIAILYKSGIAGGIMIDSRDKPNGDILDPLVPKAGKKISGQQGNFKIKTNNKKVLVFDPTYSEFMPISQITIEAYETILPEAGMELLPRDKYFDDKATLDVLRNLSGCGHILIMSHGFAWPGANSVNEVYIETGETVSLAGNKLYRKEIREKKIIPVTIVKNGKSLYYAGPDFIFDNNDLSRDTVLIYGGFCYGNLGSWTGIVSKCKAATYVSADWAVAANYCSAWAIELIGVLCNKSLPEPSSVIDWFLSNNLMPKEYFDENEGRTIKINFTGRPDLTFWTKVTAAIKPMEASGAPITVPGRINISYNLKCPVRGVDVNQLRLTWDFGDETPSQDVQQDSVINHAWSRTGTFRVTVDAKDRITGELYVSDTATVTIAPDFDLLPILNNLKHIQVDLPSNGHHYYGNGSPISEALLFIDTWSLEGSGQKIAWNGLNFSISGNTNGGTAISVEGTVSADGQVLEHVLAHRGYPNNHDVTIDLANVPLSQYNPENPDVWYSMSGPGTQAHVTRFEYKTWNGTSWDQYVSSDWEFVTIEVYFHQTR